jgi:hypothetical protein
MHRREKKSVLFTYEADLRIKRYIFWLKEIKELDSIP